MSHRLFLVRHAHVDVDTERPAHDWRLSEQGREAARQLGASPRWTDLSLIASSPEPKAVATAEPIAAAAALSLRVEQDLREVRRGATWTVGENAYVRLVGEYFAHPERPADGWEPAPEAQRRVVRCIERLLAESEGDVCAVSHGLALSLYIASLDGRATPSLEEWRSIPLPSVAVVDVERRRLLERFAQL